MRRLIVWILDGLPFDSRSRRAIDETLLDWAHEAGGARSGIRRSLINLRNLLAVLRAAAESTIREVMRVPYIWLAGRVMLFGPPFSIALVGLAASEPYLHGRTDLALAIFLWQLPQCLMLAFPAALLLAIAWRPGDREIPGVGVATIALVSTALLRLVVLPVVSPMLTAPYVRIVRADLYVSTVIWTTAEQAAALLARAGSIVLPMTSALLGASLSRNYALRSTAWIVVIPVFYALSPFAMHGALWPYGQGPVATAIFYWLFCGVTLTLAMMLRERDAPANLPGRV